MSLCRDGWRCIPPEAKELSVLQYFVLFTVVITEQPFPLKYFTIILELIQLFYFCRMTFESFIHVLMTKHLRTHIVHAFAA